MANPEHLDILKQGVETWNQWRKDTSFIPPELVKDGISITHYRNRNEVSIRPNLMAADLSGVRLQGINLSDAHLEGANLRKANLELANLDKADLRSANLWRACLRHGKLHRTDLAYAILKDANIRLAFSESANFSYANLEGANLEGAELKGTTFLGAILMGACLKEAYLKGSIFLGADLEGADLSNADLEGVVLVDTNLRKAILTQCSIYGISAWNVDLEGATQDSLVITPARELTITVDNLKVAQFIYLILDNREIREVINTIGQKGVLILGRFSEERKPVLDALREKLRALNFLPIVFDFERPTAQDFTETVKVLAGLSCFIIADITNPKSTPLELQATVPDYMLPFVPILQEGEQPFSMFVDLKRKYNDWVLDTLIYDTPSHLIEGLEEAIVKPALKKRAELLAKKGEQVQTRDIRNYLLGNNY